MFDGILTALCATQISIGNEMGADANSAEETSTMQLDLSNAWMGTATGNPGQGSETLVAWMQSSASDAVGGGGQPLMVGNLPPSGSDYNYTTQETQAAIQYIAGLEANQSGSTLTALESARQTWSTIASAMGNEKDLQTSPLNTLAQGESNQIQQDQSAVSGSSSLGNGMADLDGITASLVPTIQ